MFIGPPITAAFAVSDRSYHHLNIRRLSQGPHNVVMTFFFLEMFKLFDTLTTQAQYN